LNLSASYFPCSSRFSTYCLRFGVVQSWVTVEGQKGR
jgi:hypothetical protein